MLETLFMNKLGADKKWKLSLFPANIISLKFPLFPASEYNWRGKKFKIVLDVMLWGNLKILDNKLLL